MMEFYTGAGVGAGITMIVLGTVLAIAAWRNRHEGFPGWEYRTLRRMGGSRRASFEQWWAMLWFHDPRRDR
jgi:hypothetical protein